MADSRKSRSPDLESIAELVARRHLIPGERVVLGLSGGLDSVVLLHVFKKLAVTLGVELSCLHVNHGISPNAHFWAEFCSGLCSKWDVPLTVERVDISDHADQGIEAAARIARYAAFEKQDAQWILLAQHQDDQAETLLMQLFRGAGIKGLASMGEMGHFHGKKKLRPLLSVSRKELEAYAKESGLEWVDDESNLDQRYDRNYIRHGLSPLIEARYPAFKRTLSRSSGLLAEASGLLSELAQIDSTGAMEGGALSASRLAELSEARAKNLLRHFLETCGVRMPSERRLYEMLRQILGSRSDASVSISHDGFEIRLYRGGVHVVEQRPSANFCRQWLGEPRLDLPELDGSVFFEKALNGIDPAKLDHPLTVRSRAGGERFRPGINRPEKSLKHLFQESGIPPWQRYRLPLLYCGERIIWVPGIGLDPAFEGKNGFLPRWAPNSPQTCDRAEKA